MKMTVDIEEIAKLQREAHSCMVFLEDTYTNHVEYHTKGFSWWRKFKTSFHFPPSLRMYHMCEVLLTEEDLRRAKEYRVTWHDYWAIKHQFGDMIGCSNQEVELDEYETEVVLRLRQYK